MRRCVQDPQNKHVHTSTLVNCSFRNGALLTAGTVFLVEGILWASQYINNDTNESSLPQPGYLLQIYSGYFLITLILFLYCLSCRIWYTFGINYATVFSGDSHHCLNWIEAAELPCWSYFLLGITLNINFRSAGNDGFYQYYPIVMAGLSVVLWLTPSNIYYRASRMCLLNSVWRVCLAGIYRVEWWDVYVADMLCSLTYSTGNVSLFFCLYARKWTDPEKCDSSHSRMLGFMTTLPSVWRALQCIRRYWDTNYESIHLLNSGKYILSISFYVSLSIYRTHETLSNRWTLIALAIINSSVSGAWDVCLDWGLGNPWATHPFLRSDLRFTAPWVYYVVILINTLLRFTWILYIAVPQQLQHSAITSFGISIGEVCRRGLWSLFRVEYEYCNRSKSNAMEKQEALPPKCQPLSELGFMKASDKCHSCALQQQRHSAIFSHPNAKSPCMVLAAPECVFSTCPRCSDAKREIQSARRS